MPVGRLNFVQRDYEIISQTLGRIFRVGILAEMLRRSKQHVRAKPLAGRWCNQWAARFPPHKSKLSVFINAFNSTFNLDAAFRTGQRSIFDSIGRQLMDYQRKVLRRRRIDREIAAAGTYLVRERGQFLQDNFFE